ncbi:MAG: phage tail sheath family protein [Planctomycetaceae bacterium]
MIDQDVSEVRVITLKVTITQPDTGNQRVWTGLAPDSRHRRSGTPDSLFDTFPKDLVNSSQAASIPIWIAHEDWTDKTDAKGIDVLRALGCLKSESRSLGDTTLGEISLNGRRLDQFRLAQINYRAINPADGSSTDTEFSQMKASAIDTPQLNQVFSSGSVTLEHLMLGDKPIAEITLGQIKLGESRFEEIQLDDVNLGNSQLRPTDSPKKTLANTQLANKDFGLIKLNELQLDGNSISSLPVSVTGTHDNLDTILLGDIKLNGRKLSSIRLSELTVANVAFSDLKLGNTKLFASDNSFEKVTTEEQSFSLKDGTDGDIPTASDIAGQTGETGTNGESLAKSGLKGFEDIEDISIVAAPGSTWTPDPSKTTDAQAVCNALIRHAQKMKYRIAVLDSPLGASIQQVREFRAKFDSSHAALYYPWVRTLDPATNTDILLPPSGFVAGIYARNDINRAVYKAPANEVVTLALGFEHTLNQAHQEVLNPEGINCFRYFEGRGNRLWGARTVSSDPEWKYVNLRRYFAYLERSIDRSSQFAVFEPNGEALWANIRRMVEDFLFSEWQSGALLGDKPEKAFFVRCDRSTMNQNDLDNGRLVCLIGVAPLRPAEFVIFRIGQFTADRR